MNITINGVTKDCTEWGCENVCLCEHGCQGFKTRIKKNFKLRREFELDAEGYKAFRNQGWNGEYEEIEINPELDNTNLTQIENYMRGGSHNRIYEPSRINYGGQIVRGE